MKRFIYCIVLFFIISAVVSCNKSEKKSGEEPEGYKEAAVGIIEEPDYPAGTSFYDYDTRRQVREENPVEEDFISSVKSFSYQMADQLLNDSKDNMNFSPISLYFALALAGSGSQGATREEIYELLGAETDEELAIQCGNLYRLLYTDNEISELKISNSLWLDKKTDFFEAFMDNAVKAYYAGLFHVDFQAADTKKMMSEWVSENTNGKVVPEILFDDQQIMSILNTVYYYDEWIDRFDKAKTKEDEFHPTPDTFVLCDFMNARYASHGFLKGEGFTRSALNLKNSGSMVFILPDEDVPLSDLLTGPDAISDLFNREDSHYGEVIFQIPKFTFGSKIELADSLKALGITSAFQEETADFGRITNGRAYLSGILQQTHIAIDETGVEAVSYTEINYAGSAAPSGRAEMILDRPFLFAIFKNYDTPLFIGICNDPSEAVPR